MNNAQRRVGVLLPPGNVTVEREFGAHAPPEIALNYNRMSRPVSKSTKSSLLSMIPSLERAAVDLAHVHPELILFACTSGSFLEGRGKETISRAITGPTGIRRSDLHGRPPPDALESSAIHYHAYPTTSTTMKRFPRALTHRVPSTTRSLRGDSSPRRSSGDVPRCARRRATRQVRCALLSFTSPADGLVEEVERVSECRS